MAEGVAHAGALDVDHFRTEIGQQGAAVGHGDQGAGIDDAHSGKGTVLGNDKFAFAHDENSFS